MSPLVNDTLEFISSPTFNMVQVIVLSYIGLLWLSVIVWVTRDSIHRSNSLFFQTFSIILNIGIPILGSLLYLIIRPNQTTAEKYYEEMEHKMLTEGIEDGITCEKCLTIVDKEFAFCPNCGIQVQKICKHCKKGYSSKWNICPYCGTDEDEKKVTKKSPAVGKEQSQSTKKVTTKKTTAKK